MKEYLIRLELENGTNLELQFDANNELQFRSQAEKYGFEFRRNGKLKRPSDEVIEKFERFNEASLLVTEETGIEFSNRLLMGGSDLEVTSNHPLNKLDEFDEKTKAEVAEFYAKFDNKNILRVSNDILEYTPEQLEIIVSHEAGHIINRDSELIVNARGHIFLQFQTDTVDSIRKGPKNYNPEIFVDDTKLNELTSNLVSSSEALFKFYKDNNIDYNDAGSYKQFFENSDKKQDYIDLVRSHSDSVIVLQRYLSPELFENQQFQTWLEDNEDIYESYERKISTSSENLQKVLYKSSKAMELIADQRNDKNHDEFLEIVDGFTDANIESGTHPDKDTRSFNIIMDKITEENGVSGIKVSEQEYLEFLEAAKQMDNYEVIADGDFNRQITATKGNNNYVYNIEVDDETIGRN
jgi:hypothetical protein